MSNWFASGLKELTSNLAAASENLQNALPIDKETLAKLTLNTPDMIQERAQFQQEYSHKNAVQNSLAHMYPWETRDAERDILVEECKEAILALSHDKETFFGPYLMPTLDVNTEDDEEEKTEEEELLEEEAPVKEVKDKEPSLDSREKLAKLEPLPPLLADFDLIAHVGLIQKMLKVDPKLVERQSTLSGGGDREKVFWRNYFFHCAFTRYEAGLSIDEIWSDQPPQLPPMTGSGNSSSHASAAVELTPEEIVTFDHSAAPSETASLHESEGGEELFVDQTDCSPDYEMVENDASDNNLGEDDEEDAFAGEMDELEAEIAKELED